MEKEFELLQDVLNNTASHGELLGIDPNDFKQVFAARKFIKTLLKTSDHYRDFFEIKSNYCRKMANQKNYNSNISPVSSKNLMLLQNDPVKKLSQNDTSDPLDIILSKTHFQTPNMKTTFLIEGKVIEQIQGPSREEARKLIENALRGLLDNPHTKLIVQALAVLIRQDKAQFFFSNNTFGAGSFVKNYQNNFTIFNAPAGFYNQKSSIFFASLINPSDQKIEVQTLGTFIHESLHMLFKKLVKNASSPVTPNSREEKLLNEALEKDRQHRTKLCEQELSSKEKAVWNTLVDSLEKEPSYFSGGFKASHQEHLHTMQVEAIVRPLEQLAEGAEEKDLEKICPNLWNFYKEYSVKILESYVSEYYNKQSECKLNEKKSIEDKASFIVENKPKSPPPIITSNRPKSNESSNISSNASKVSGLNIIDNIKGFFSALWKQTIRKLAHWIKLIPIFRIK